MVDPQRIHTQAQEIVIKDQKTEIMFGTSMSESKEKIKSYKRKLRKAHRKENTIN